MAEKSEHRKLKFLAHSFEATGHLNGVIGFCQALEELGHECVFAINESRAKMVEKYGFRTIPLIQNPEGSEGGFAFSSDPIMDMGANIRTKGFFEHMTTLEQARNFCATQEKAQSMQKKMNLMIKFHPQFEAIIEREQPIDAFILDHFMFPPAFGRDDIPWIFLGSFAPLGIYNCRELPPSCSGYPVNDRTGWPEFFEVNKAAVEYRRKFQDELEERLGYKKNGHYWYEGYFAKSPFLNIHQIPKELDYRDIYEPPDHIIAVDGFARKETGKLERLPEEFQNASENGDELVYLSMGSMCSFDIELMKRMTAILSTIPGVKTIVSKGPRGDEYELPVNCWGRNSLPQQVVVELVDLVIHHGGNNSVCETFAAGKPMIVLPLFGDQYDNAQRVTETGYGRKLEPYNFQDEDLVKAVQELLADEEMKARLQVAKKRIALENTRMKAAKIVEEKLLNYR